MSDEMEELQGPGEAWLAADKYARSFSANDTEDRVQTARIDFLGGVGWARRAPDLSQLRRAFEAGFDESNEPYERDAEQAFQAWLNDEGLGDSSEHNLETEGKDEKPR
jgi:hypothetical protein